MCGVCFRGCRIYKDNQVWEFSEMKRMISMNCTKVSMSSLSVDCRYPNFSTLYSKKAKGNGISMQTTHLLSEQTSSFCTENCTNELNQLSLAWGAAFLVSVIGCDLNAKLISDCQSITRVIVRSFKLSCTRKSLLQLDILLLNTTREIDVRRSSCLCTISPSVHLMLTS